MISPSSQSSQPHSNFDSPRVNKPRRVLNQQRNVHIFYSSKRQFLHRRQEIAIGFRALRITSDYLVLAGNETPEGSIVELTNHV